MKDSNISRDHIAMEAMKELLKEISKKSHKSLACVDELRIF